MKNLLSNTALIFTAAIFALTAFPAAAENQSLGNIMCSVSFNLAPFESLFVGLAYITGAILIGNGLIQLSYFTDAINSPRSVQLGRSKGHFISGSCLLALPAFTRLMVNTFFNFSFQSDFGGGLSACVPAADSAGIGNGFENPIALDSMIINMVYDIRSPMVFILSVLAILMGIFLIFRGLLKASKFGQERTTSIPHILWDVVAGTMLYTLGTSMNTIMTAIFGDGTMGGSGIALANLATDGNGNTEGLQNAVYAALTFVQLIGMVIFIRGWLLLKDGADYSGSGKDKIVQGLSHIVCGVLAVNIYRFLDVTNATFSP
jgi:hypothetical protein